MTDQIWCIRNTLYYSEGNHQTAMRVFKTKEDAVKYRSDLIENYHRIGYEDPETCVSAVIPITFCKEYLGVWDPVRILKL